MFMILYFSSVEKQVMALDGPMVEKASAIMRLSQTQCIQCEISKIIRNGSVMNEY